MFNFQNSAAFLLLLLIPTLFILRKLGIFTQITYPATLADWAGECFIWKAKFRKFLSVLAKVMISLGFVAAVCAFADPVLSTHEKVYTSLGTDIIFVIDTSPSMAARDIDGITRLEAAKNSISTLVTENDGYRYGIVALGSQASIYVPPTNDFSIFRKRLSEIQVGLLGNGSAIGDGLSTALCHLQSSTAPKKCIVLFTDGENNAGEIHPQTAAKLASENKISLYLVGVGSKGTVPIEYKDPNTDKLYSGYLESDFDSAAMKEIARAGKGRYFEVRSLEELTMALNTVTKNEVITQSYTYKTVTTPIYKKFLFYAMILISIAWILRRIVLQEKINFHYRKILILRFFLILFSVVMIICAYLGFSWGTYFAPVQKSGTSVSFVIDISNSMMAKDTEKGITRLDAVSIYARKLLSKMNNTSVSVVLSKGEGITAIPLTQDSSMIESLLDVLSPAMMTAPGSSLGKGILAAKDSFPQNFATAGRIWVFTDGEETDNNLSNALTECIKSGIPVTIIGFGSEEGTETLAGDKKTIVQTALQTEKIKETIQLTGSNMSFYRNQTPITFLRAEDKGSATVLLNQLSENNQDNQIISYEAKAIPRFKLFLILAILSFAFSFIFTEMDWHKILSQKKGSTKTNAKKTAGLIIFTSLIFTSCSQSASILQGTYAFYKKQYRSAIAYFKAALEKSDSQDQNKDYILYNLGTAYSLIGEQEAALEEFSLISDKASDSVKYAAFYNAGIIANQKADYETAQNYFKEALKIDSTKINAKINLELSIQMAEAEVKQKEAEAIPASEEHSQLPDIEKGIYKHVKENDKKQWQNSVPKETVNLETDY